MTWRLLSLVVIIGTAQVAGSDPHKGSDTDGQADSLPVGALTRLGMVRFQEVGRTFSVVFSPDGKTVAAGAWDGSIRLWEVASGKEVLQFAGHKGWVKTVA